MQDHQKDNFFKKDNSLTDQRRNIELFHGDQNLYILYRRVQNLVAAVFLVTSSLDDTEELKSSLRRVGLRALGNTALLVQIQSMDEKNLRNLAAPILEMNSLLAISFWGGVISEMNSIVLQKEITKIEKDIHTVIDTHKNRYLISPALFKDTDDIEHQMAVSKTSNHQQTQDKGHYKRQDIKDTIKDKRHTESVHNQNPAPEHKTERRSVILKLLAEKQNLSVKDFSTVITQYSEKTIQRELLSLVIEGVVKKEGERRWSTYSLVM